MHDTSSLIHVYIFNNVLTDSSQDQAMVDLLEVLADDGFRANRSKTVSQQLSASCIYNSDDEEAVPELEKRESELSKIMSQRWDSDMPENSSARKRSPNFILVNFWNCLLSAFNSYLWFYMISQTHLIRKVKLLNPF